MINKKENGEVCSLTSMCSGNQARSKVKDSRSLIWPDWSLDGISFPVGVRRFESCPLHHTSAQT
jgi:hypothetical protein